MTPRRRFLLNTAIVLAFWLLPLAIYWPVTLGGRTMLPADNLFQWEPWASHADSLSVPADPNQRSPHQIATAVPTAISKGRRAPRTPTPVSETGPIVSDTLSLVDATKDSAVIAPKPNANPEMLHSFASSRPHSRAGCWANSTR